MEPQNDYIKDDDVIKTTALIPFGNWKKLKALSTRRRKPLYVILNEMITHSLNDANVKRELKGEDL